jgi:hypothetical protein
MDAGGFSQNSRAGWRHKFNRTVNSGKGRVADQG